MRFTVKKKTRKLRDKRNVTIIKPNGWKNTNTKRKTKCMAVNCRTRTGKSVRLKEHQPRPKKVSLTKGQGDNRKSLG